MATLTVRGTLATTVGELAPEIARLDTQHQPTLPLIQMRPQRRIPPTRGLRQLRNIGDSTTVGLPARKTYVITPAP